MTHHSPSPQRRASADHDFHDWETGDKWGVILGVSRCKKCGEIASHERMRGWCAPARGDGGAERKDQGK